MLINTDLVPSGPYSDVVVLIDVLRTCTVAPILFDQGAVSLSLTTSMRRARAASGSGKTLVGERQGVPPEGFNHGNSPANLARVGLQGREVVMVSENAPRWLEQLGGARQVLLGSLYNAGAVARLAAELASGRIDLVCSGFSGEPDLDDTLAAAVIAGLLVAVLALFFQKTRIGRALRAVADDHAAAQSVGIPLNQIWFIVWLVAGLVALVAGAVWGSKLGVQFSLSLLALKALPVLILGGFTSVPGAIIGGLIIGAGEKLAEVYVGPSMGGGIEIWFAYVLALAFLLVRPQGLFGEKIIERV